MEPSLAQATASLNSLSAGIRVASSPGGQITPSGKVVNDAEFATPPSAAGDTEAVLSNAAGVQRRAYSSTGRRGYSGSLPLTDNFSGGLGSQGEECFGGGDFGQFVDLTSPDLDFFNDPYLPMLGGNDVRPMSCSSVISTADVNDLSAVRAPPSGATVEGEGGWRFQTPGEEKKKKQPKSKAKSSRLEITLGDPVEGQASIQVQVVERDAEGCQVACTNMWLLAVGPRHCAFVDTAWGSGMVCRDHLLVPRSGVDKTITKAFKKITRWHVTNETRELGVVHTRTLTCRHTHTNIHTHTHTRTYIQGRTHMHVLCNSCELYADPFEYLHYRYVIPGL